MASQFYPSDLQLDRAFVARAMKAPYLEQQEEYDLVRRYQQKGDAKALHLLTAAYYRLVIKVASKFRHYGLPLSDYTAVNLRTGESKPVLPGFGGYTTPSPSLSPTGKHLAAFDGKDWFTVSVPDGKRTVLTKGLKVKFASEDDDHPGSPPPAGQAQWTSCLLYTSPSPRD